ncbi:MAG: hypothetical protein PUA90_01865 [bacterium]|nr:hypothetical protein [bacterium]
MKKDKKFLIQLEEELSGISKKEKNIILLKYENLIKSELKNKKTITKIINELGNVHDLAQKEKDILKENRFYNKFWKFITKERQLPKKENKPKKIKIEVIREYDIADPPKVKNQIIDSKEVIEIEKQVVKEKKNKTKKKAKEKVRFNIKLKELFSNINIFKKSKNKNKLKKKSNNKKVPVIKVNKVDSRLEIEDDEIIYPLTKNQFILRLLGIILLFILFVIWCFICTLFISSIFAYLDGVKIIGINIALIGLVILLLIIILAINKAIFRKKNNFKLNLIIIISSIVLISFGVSSTIYSIYKLERVNDVSEKYSMTSKIETFNLPSNSSSMNILFNSEYDTQYIIKYDDNLDNKFKIEVKYYEEYYDYYIKKSTNDIYISLSPDFRDRLSVYISDIKDNKIFDNNELKRYVVKITINKKDYSRLIIQD